MESGCVGVRASGVLIAHGVVDFLVFCETNVLLVRIIVYLKRLLVILRNLQRSNRHGNDFNPKGKTRRVSRS